eukprot:1158608-Pelagomonas_calceolata.AAC.5
MRYRSREKRQHSKHKVTQDEQMTKEQQDVHLRSWSPAIFVAGAAVPLAPTYEHLHATAWKEGKVHESKLKQILKHRRSFLLVTKQGTTPRGSTPSRSCLVRCAYLKQAADLVENRVTAFLHPQHAKWTAAGLTLALQAAPSKHQVAHHALEDEPGKQEHLHPSLSSAATKAAQSLQMPPTHWQGGLHPPAAAAAAAPGLAVPSVGAHLPACPAAAAAAAAAPAALAAAAAAPVWVKASAAFGAAPGDGGLRGKPGGTRLGPPCHSPCGGWTEAGGAGLAHSAAGMQARGGSGGEGAQRMLWKEAPVLERARQSKQDAMERSTCTRAC